MLQSKISHQPTCHCSNQPAPFDMSTAPPNRLSRLPTYISRWLGYRPTPPAKNPEYVVWLWSWIGAFCGISLIQAVFQQSHYFVERGVPSIVASYVRTNIRLPLASN